jgi:hypothetical protein
MSGGHIFLMVFCLVFLAVLAAGFTRAYIVERDFRRRHEEARREQEAEETAYYEFFNKQKAVIEARFDGSIGYILDFVADDRLHLCSARSKDVNGVVRVPRMQRDIYNWCRSNIRGKFEMVPFMNGEPVKHQLWFADPNDAMYFKMRWY